VYIEYKGHRDRVELQIITDWWHSDLASTEDNQNKQPIRVYHADDGRPRACALKRAARLARRTTTAIATATTPAVDASPADAAADAAAGDEDGSPPRAYDIHWRRAQLVSIKASLIAFHSSPHAKLLAEATKTAKRPNGVVVGVKLLKKGRCPCVKPRRTSECDCKICSLVHHNLPIFNKSRQIWWKRSTCECGTCSSEQTKKAWRVVSKSLRALESTLLPCGKVPYPQISFEGRPPFEMYHRECTLGSCEFGKPPSFRPPCPARDANNNTLCGWAKVFPKPCPIEYSETERMRWHAWEPRLRGTSKDGTDFYADELVPREGTRAQFMGEFRRAVEAYLPHIWEVRLMLHSCRLMEERKDGKTVTRHSDYAAQVPIQRASTATCASKEHINNCVSVMGFKPIAKVSAAPRALRLAVRPI
jgi:hypothetical protein